MAGDGLSESQNLCIVRHSSTPKSRFRTAKNRPNLGGGVEMASGKLTHYPYFRAIGKNMSRQYTTSQTGEHHMPIQSAVGLRHKDNLA